MPAETVHFTISGEFVTERARDLWNLEGEPEKAMNLMECMHGITKDEIMDVLEGRKKMVGNSSTGIKLAPDGKYRGKTLQQVIGKIRKERDEAADERADLMQMAIGDTVALASPTGLRKVARRKTERRYIKGSNRAVMTNDYEFDDVLADPETPEIEGRGTKPLKIWQQCEPSGYLSRASNDDEADEPADPRAARAEQIIMDSIDDDEEDEEEPERPPAPPAEDKIRRNDPEGAQGWVDPEGQFYPCGYAQHAQTAWKLGLTDNPSAHGLEVTGWARLGVTGGSQYFFGEHTLFGEKVNAAIKAYCEEQKIELPYWLREED